jgi:hypothetical protein
MSLKQAVRTKMSEAYIDAKMNFFKKGYQPRTNLVKDEKGDLLADSHSILKDGRITSISC